MHAITNKHKHPEVSFRVLDNLHSTMNNDDLKSALRQRIGLSESDSDNIFEATIDAIKECSKNLDTVAIPGFGSFSCSKTDESIVIDESTGTNTLVPPKIELSFRTSVVLKKKFVG